jgi:hypothetical protein
MRKEDDDEHEHNDVGYAYIEIRGVYPWDWGLNVEDTDTQGILRDKGVFAAIHQRLHLPTSYTILGIYFRMMQRVWDIGVQSPDLPRVSDYEMAPRIMFHETHHPEEGICLVEAKLGEQWLYSYVEEREYAKERFFNQ